MRCLVVADLHCSLPQLDWLVSAAPQFDLVIFAGDAAVDRSRCAAEAAGCLCRGAAGLAHILGSDCRSEPGETSTGGRLIMLWSTSLTMARYVP